MSTEVKHLELSAADQAKLIPILQGYSNPADVNWPAWCASLFTSAPGGGYYFMPEGILGQGPGVDQVAALFALVEYVLAH